MLKNKKKGFLQWEVFLLLFFLVGFFNSKLGCGPFIWPTKCLLSVLSKLSVIAFTEQIIFHVICWEEKKTITNISIHYITKKREFTDQNSGQSEKQNKVELCLKTSCCDNIVLKLWLQNLKYVLNTSESYSWP